MRVPRKLATELGAARGNKYRNKRTEVDGISFASKAEAKRWGELQLLLRVGLIENLEWQPSYPLTVNGFHICDYRADFSYWDVKAGKQVVEDVKGMRLQLFKLKAKLFEAVYGFPITEIQA